MGHEDHRFRLTPVTGGAVPHCALSFHLIICIFKKQNAPERKTSREAWRSNLDSVEDYWKEEADWILSEETVRI